MDCRCRGAAGRDGECRILAGGHRLVGGLRGDAWRDGRRVDRQRGGVAGDSIRAVVHQAAVLVAVQTGTRAHRQCRQSHAVIGARVGQIAPIGTVVGGQLPLECRRGCAAGRDGEGCILAGDHCLVGGLRGDAGRDGRRVDRQGGSVAGRGACAVAYQATVLVAGQTGTRAHCQRRQIHTAIGASVGQIAPTGTIVGGHLPLEGRRRCAAGRHGEGRVLTRAHRHARRLRRDDGRRAD